MYMHQFYILHTGLREAVSFNISSLVPPSPIPPNKPPTSYTPSQDHTHKPVNMGVSINITRVGVNGRGYKKSRSVKSVGVRGGGPVAKLKRDVDILLTSPDNE